MPKLFLIYYYNTFSILDAKYDQRLMDKECYKLLGIQQRSRTKSPRSQLDTELFLVAKSARLVVGSSAASHFACQRATV